MKILILSFLFPLICMAQENTSQAAKDLSIVEGDYTLTKGNSNYCSAGGPVGWFKTEKSDFDKDGYMLMVGTKFIFANINVPETKQTFPDCEYITKTEVKRHSGVGFLIETENQNCKNLNRIVRKSLRFEKDKISMDIYIKTEENGKKSNETSECVFELKRPSRFQQSIKK